jgi:hypothetical protein
MTDTELQQKRLIAAAIDIAIVIVVCIAIGIGEFVVQLVLAHSGIGVIAMGAVGFIGQIAILGFILARDVVMGDRSLGKKFQEIRVVDSGGRPIEFMDSAKRNAIFAIGSVLGVVSGAFQMIPCVGHLVACLLLPLLLLGALVGLVAVIVELVKIIQDPAGIRFGDQFAGTKVVR